jgi:alpha-tubulin suppressor-like RCC1 family protein
VALQDDGVNKQLYAFGSNLFLTGNDNQVYKFSKIPSTTFAGGTNWKQVSTGYRHTSAIKTDGTLWTWGSGYSGQLGNIQITSRSTPVTTFAGGTNWKQVTIGYSSTGAIKTDGTLWMWGQYQFGKLGFYDINFTETRTTPITTFAGGNNWADTATTNPEDLYTIFAGSTYGADEHVVTAIKTDGTLWTWGYEGFYGSLGINNYNSNIRTLTPVTTFAGGTNWKQLGTSGFSSAAIKTDGTLWTWGSNYNGSLGTNNVVQNDTEQRKTPVTTFAGGTNWKQVTIGYSSTGAIKTDGTLWMWGYNINGQLGINNETETLTPVTTFAGGTDWKQVSCGGYMTGAIKTDGTLWMWGANFYGDAGINDFGRPITPVTTFAGGTNWKQVSCSAAGHVGAVKTDGTLWLWGKANLGMLGNAVDTGEIYTPVTTFAGGTDWKQVSCGGIHSSSIGSTAAIKTDGTLWTWGYNYQGSLGTNDTTDSSTPVTTFIGGTNWRQVNNSCSVTVALKGDGISNEIYVFGNSNYLGINYISSVITPVTTFAGGTNWKQVSAGSNHTAAIKTDGTLWVWGIGYSGVLGNAVTTNVFTPITTFAGGTDWKQVSASANNTMAIKSIDY